MLDRHERTAGIDSVFWREWQQYRDYFYGCCLRWMRGNQTEAEDALSMAMLRAREGLLKRTEPIDNLKAWLVRLVNNLCADLVKRRDRLVLGIEDSEWASQEEWPALAATRQELELFFEGEVNNLSPKLRQTFLLYWKEKLSYGEIAERLGISQGTARKRISNARAILRQRWNEYEGVAEDSGSSLAADLVTDLTDELSVGEPALLATDLVTDLTDGLSVGEPASGRLGEAKRNPTRAPRRLGEVKRNPTRAELSVGEPVLLATDLVTDLTDGLSVGELTSGRLGEVKRNPTRVNPAELRPKEQLLRADIEKYLVLWKKTLGLIPHCLFPKTDDFTTRGPWRKKYFGTNEIPFPGKPQWGLLALLLLLLPLLPGSFAVAWLVWADSGGDS